MKIVVLTGSAHKNGTSAHLAEKFIQGAKDAGHEISRFDTALLKIHPCTGCGHCECGKNECIFKDDMLEIYPKLIEADLIAFATPTYYHGALAQIKTAIDRFYGIDNFLCGAHKKAVLLVSAADTKPGVTSGVVATYEANMKYLKWVDCGKVLATGCSQLSELMKTDYPMQAYRLGKEPPVK